MPARGRVTATARPRERSESSASRSGSVALSLEDSPARSGRPCSVIEILQLVVEPGVIGIVRGRVGLVPPRTIPGPARYASPPAPQDAREPERAERDADHWHEPYRPQDAPVWRDSQRFRPVLLCIFRDDPIAGFSSAELDSDILASFVRRLARARRQQVSRARPAH